MPELPELQALAERLTSSLAGASLTAATPLWFSGLKTVEPEVETVIGRGLQRVDRRGKYLVFDLAGPRVLVHLSQGGRIDLELPAKATRPKGAVVRLSFAPQGSVLVKEYGTQRKSGWWVLAQGDEGPLAALGPEPFDDGFAALVRQGADGRRLHTMLRDQRTVAGIGRGYADDILHRAALSPFATLARLAAAERERLLQATRQVLAQALEKERSRSGGLPAKLGGRFSVHGRHGEPCPVCGGPLGRVSYEDYEIVYCPGCQTGGRRLADRRMSRLLR